MRWSGVHVEWNLMSRTSLRITSFCLNRTLQKCGNMIGKHHCQQWLDPVGRDHWLSALGVSDFAMPDSSQTREVRFK